MGACARDVRTPYTRSTSAELTVIHVTCTCDDDRRGVPFPRELHGSEGYESTCCHYGGYPGNLGRRNSNSKHEFISAQASKVSRTTWRNPGILLRLCNIPDEVPLSPPRGRTLLYSRFGRCSVGVMCGRERVSIQPRSDQFVIRSSRPVPVPGAPAVLLLEVNPRPCISSAGSMEFEPSCT